ncbi:hypothetical protein HNR44_000320 [Geomicrobium halophilum]|uniref:Uncharacterized protein n=1 Tax=Geomicrobium halophilum TaxID=549000 RepID=A0A841PPY8_9BACL|nr:hypothetical protein [Geomicrobium halophilum]MBB6448371.1 hypothetical protein [Geomicrobium halophilum]
MAKLMATILILLSTLIPLMGCFDTSGDEVEGELEGPDSEEAQRTEEGAEQEEKHARDHGDLESFVFSFLEAINRGDENEVELMVRFENGEEESPADSVIAEFVNFSMDTANVHVLEGEQARATTSKYFDDMEQYEAEIVSILIAGRYEGDGAEKYGNSSMMIRNDLLVREQEDNWEVVGSFTHTPLSVEQIAANQGGLLFTPEAFISEYYNQLENKEHDELFNKFSDTYHTYQEDGLQTDAEKFVEKLTKRETELQDIRVIMGDLYNEEIQEVIPELLPYTTEKDDYIVRVQYRLNQGGPPYTEDILVSEINGEWQISTIHRYD